jgi:hypothetical protein
MVSKTSQANFDNRSKTRGTKLSNGVRVETRDNLRDYFYAVLEDNDSNQRLVGF